MSTHDIEPPHDKTNKMACVDILPVWSVFAVGMKNHWDLSYTESIQRRLWSDWADAQADLSLCWAHMTFDWFCCVVAQFFVMGKYGKLPQNYHQIQTISISLVNAALLNCHSVNTWIHQGHLHFITTKHHNISRRKPSLFNDVPSIPYNLTAIGENSPHRID